MGGPRPHGGGYRGIDDLIFRADGALLYVGIWNRVTTYDVATRRRVDRVRLRGPLVLIGDRLYGWRRGRVAWIDTTTGAVHLGPRLPVPTFDVAIDPIRREALTYDDDVLCVWDLDAGRPLRGWPSEGLGPVRDGRMQLDSRWLDTRSGELRPREPLRGADHPPIEAYDDTLARVTAAGLADRAWSIARQTGGVRIVVGGDAGDLHVLDETVRTLVPAMPRVVGIAWAGEELRVVTNDGTCHRWDAGGRIGTTPPPEAVDRWLEVAPGGARIAGRTPGRIVVWDAASGEVIWRFEHEPQTRVRLSLGDDAVAVWTRERLVLHRFAGPEVEIALDERLSAIGLGPGGAAALIQPTVSGASLLVLTPGGRRLVTPSPGRRFMELAWATRGASLLVGSSWWVVLLEGLETTLQECRLQAPFDGLSVGLAREGGTFVGVSAYNPGVWWVDEARTTNELRFPTLAYGTAVAFSPGGDRVATGGSDGSITVWDVATRRVLYTHHVLPEGDWATVLPNGMWTGSAGASRCLRGGTEVSADSGRWIRAWASRPGEQPTRRTPERPQKAAPGAPQSP